MPPAAILMIEATSAGSTGCRIGLPERVVTVRIDAVEFLKPVSVGDDVSVFRELEVEGGASVAVRIEL